MFRLNINTKVLWCFNSSTKHSKSLDFLLKDEVNLPGWLASFYQLHFRKESLANDRLELLMDENNIL